MMSDNRYVSFMLRLQWMENKDHPTWVASIQSTKTGELHCFPSLDTLIEFLWDEFGHCKAQALSPPIMLSQTDDSLPEHP